MDERFDPWTAPPDREALSPADDLDAFEPAPWPPPPVHPVSPPPQPPRHRVWTALVVGIGAIPAALLVTILVMVVGAVILMIGGDAGPADIEQKLGEFMATPLGLFAVVVPAQLVFAGAAFGAATLSPQPVRERLGLTRGRVRPLLWPLFMLSTPIIAICSTIILGALFDETSEHLESLMRLFTEAEGAMAIYILLLLSIPPGIFEETLFRGYLQRRLQVAWHPALAVACASVIFSAAHIDPQHALGVLPLGVWLGVVAWSCGSIVPAICCHFFNNFTMIGLSMLAPTSEEAAAEASALPGLLLLLVSGAALISSIVVMVRATRGGDGLGENPDPPAPALPV